MKSQARCVIVGASHAAAQCAFELRKLGWPGVINMITDDHFLPYHRPPLSKEFLTGVKPLENLLIRSPTAYHQANIRISLGATVVAIERAKKLLVLKDGEHLRYDKLILTTGARVRKIGIPGENLEGVFYLRNLFDAQQVKALTHPKKTAVIIGGGYIGLETASALRQLGMQVTVLESQPRILQRVTAPQVAAFYTRIHAEEGVDIVCNALVVKITGERVAEAVICADGTEHRADIVIIGAGVIPNTELAEQAGLQVDNGIIVDEFARTNDQDILAAGDCTSHFNPIYETHVRLESVQNATDQASVAANTVVGKPHAYSALPWFWSDQYDLKLQIAGLSSGYTDLVVRGDADGGRRFSAFYLRDGKLLAVDAVNRPQDFVFGKRLILQGTRLDIERLADDTYSLKELLSR